MANKRLIFGRNMHVRQMLSGAWLAEINNYLFCHIVIRPNYADPGIWTDLLDSDKLWVCGSGLPFGPQIKSVDREGVRCIVDSAAVTIMQGLVTLREANSCVKVG
jgi:hypothetical protein